MQHWQTMGALFTILLSFSNHCYSNLISTSGLGANGNFFDNGIITTEYREDGSVWEWLDLTVTNRISFNSLKNDLNDDGKLNNSISGDLSGTLGAIWDVEALSVKNMSHWRIATNHLVANLINNYFGISLRIDSNPDRHLFDNNEDIVNEFIWLFGNTVYESTGDINPYLPIEPYTSGDPSFAGGFTYSQTNSGWTIASSYVEGFTNGAGVVEPFRAVTFNYLVSSADTEFPSFGTWLTRDVTAVPTPTSLYLFVIANSLFLLRHGLLHIKNSNTNFAFQLDWN